MTVNKQSLLLTVTCPVMGYLITNSYNSAGNKETEARQKYRTLYSAEKNKRNEQNYLVQ